MVDTARIEVTPGESLKSVRHRMVKLNLDQAGGNKTAAARAMGVSLKTFYNWLAEIETMEAGHGARLD